MIAMALLFTPDLIIMDEPTSALDVVAQRSLMVQIKELQQRLGFAVVFVTHDMSLISHFSDQLVVMYAGQVVELGATRAVFDHPAHPYSKGLLDAFPSIRGPKVPLTGIPGSPPNLADPPAGCRFHPRCPEAFADCPRVEPELYQVGAVRARCLLHAPTARSRPNAVRGASLMTDLRPSNRLLDRSGRREHATPLIETERPDPALPGRPRASPATMLHAVDDVDITIDRQEIVALAGESGSGKSTIARLLARRLPTDERRDLLPGPALSSCGRAATSWPTAATCRWCSRIRSARSIPPSASPTASCAASSCTAASSPVHSGTTKPSESSRRSG